MSRISRVVSSKTSKQIQNASDIGWKQTSNSSYVLSVIENEGENSNLENINEAEALRSGRDVNVAVGRHIIF